MEWKDDMYAELTRYDGIDRTVFSVGDYVHHRDRGVDGTVINIQEGIDGRFTTVVTDSGRRISDVYDNFSLI